MDAIFSRRSIRKYKADKVSKELIEQLIEAAQAAPSGKNKQPWKYLIYEYHEKESLLNAMEEGLNRTNKELSDLSINSNYEQEVLIKQESLKLADAYNTLRIMREAPVILIVLNAYSRSPYKEITEDERITEIIDSLSIGASIQNLLLKACELNLGTLWIGNTFFAYQELEDFIQTDWQVTCAIALGYPNECPSARPRKSLDIISEYHIND